MFCTFFIGSVGVNLLNFRIRFYIFENIIQDIKFYSKQNYEKSDAAEITVQKIYSLLMLRTTIANQNYFQNWNNDPLHKANT